MNYDVSMVFYIVSYEQIKAKKQAEEFKKQSDAIRRRNGH